MDVLIVIHSLAHGGAEKQAVLDANYLLGRGHRVTMAYRRPGALEDLLLPGISRLQVRSKKALYAARQIVTHLKSHNYHIVHCHMAWAAKAAVIPARLAGCRVIINEHGLGLWRKWYHRFMMRFLACFAHGVANSCDASKKVRREGEKIPNRKLRTLHNAVELPAGLSSARPGRREDPFTIGFVGRFHEVKRLFLFLEVAERLIAAERKFKIILVGDGPEKEGLETEISKRGLDAYFLLPGSVLEPGEYYHSFQVFMLLSRIEGFSVALIEAAGYGLPIITFDVGGNSEIVQQEETGYLVPPGDMISLTEKLLYLMNHPGEREKMGRAAAHFVKTHLTMESRVGKLVDYYTDLMNR